MHSRKTLKLNPKTWDVATDGVGRIALATDDGATAQAVANEARLFTKDAYFAQDKGIPHFRTDLGRRVSNAVVRSNLRTAALAVPDVKEVTGVDVTGFDPATRALTGVLRFTTTGSAEDGTVATYF